MTTLEHEVVGVSSYKAFFAFMHLKKIVVLLGSIKAYEMLVFYQADICDLTILPESTARHSCSTSIGF